ncbi:sensor histidine kinase [Intrasporangium sp. YIM S08009]|uniref:sensor histidine kinase n=1 Tax=Intrasporangium zincisolvens TaxID=3080018 RepID=UPI002B0608C9|nr:ATP-binding protein [Intrasporangium sp. YIM S08009]
MVTRADLRAVPLFDGLSDEQLDALLAAGEEVAVGPGDLLFREGEHADAWWVLLDGSLELSRHSGREDVVVGRMDVPGRWAGGFRAWDENGVYLATGRGREPGRVLRVPAERLRTFADTWFPFAAHLVAGLYGTARSIEATARQRSALVTLGTLAAGLAHEINNPAAAASRSAADLEQACDALLEGLRDLAGRAVTAEQFRALDALRRELEPPTVLPDALEQADREEALGDWLEKHGIARPWEISSTLVAAGADVAWCERVTHAVPPHAVGPAVAWVGATVDVAALLRQVRESTRRVSELVSAVKSYSQMDRASLQRVDVRDGLESTLLVMGPRLRDGVTVVRDWGTGVPAVEGLPGELNQVWTNLVDNAVDAMDGSGTLTVTTRAEEGWVVVSVHDTGPGLDAEALERAFEAFYTTKEVGRGSGLGLDIARRIVVDRHSGTIEVDSRPGDTTFRVRLPVADAS